MKTLALLLIAFFFCCSCQKQNPYEPKIPTAQQDSIKYKIIRYLGKKPKKATHENKFDSQFDDYYQDQAFVKHQIDLHALMPDGTEYLLISRIAPSLEEKRVATGIRLQFDQQGNLTTYEEIFRTWKMRPEVLKERASMLFEKMVKGEDLSPYYPQNSVEEYIEFPDAKTTYDKEKRTWKVQSTDI
jgi:hypothetical protein